MVMAWLLLSVLSGSLLTVECGDILRPAAIIPWSEYRLRQSGTTTFSPIVRPRHSLIPEMPLSSNSDQLLPVTESDAFPDVPPSSIISQSPKRMMSEFASTAPAITPYSTAAVYKKKVKPLKNRNSYRGVIRPQTRNKLHPDDPRNKPTKFTQERPHVMPMNVSPPHYNPPSMNRPITADVDSGFVAPPNVPAIQPIAPLSSTDVLSQQQRVSQPLRPLTAIESAQGTGMPEYVDENGRPLREQQLPASVGTTNEFSRLAAGVANVNGIDMNQLAQLQSALGNNLPHYTRISPASAHVPAAEQQANIIKSFFAQPQAANTFFGGNPGMASAAGVEGTAMKNPLEGLLSGGSPFDQLSKLATNLFSGNGQVSTNILKMPSLAPIQGNLLETMSNMLTGSSVGGRSAGVGTAAEVDAPDLHARKPEPSIMEKLLSTAANAFTESMKHKEREDRFDILKKEEQAQTAKPKEEVKEKLSRDMESSLKLLEGLPVEQRSLLEAAIKSGEIDSDALAPAIQSLVKEDTKEESKKEKESRLLEWIRENRPAKPKSVKAIVSEKLPYYGKYCGSFAVQGNTKRPVLPSGALWAVDNQRLIVSKFYFQPLSLSDNVTFWVGPNVPTNDPVSDSFPSANGFYVKPTPINITTFVIETLPPIKATVRNFTKEEEKPRTRRDAIIEVQKDEVPPKQAEEDNEVVRLLVKGDAVKIQQDPQSILVLSNHSIPLNDTFLTGLPSSILNTLVPRGFELRPPLPSSASDQPGGIVPLDWNAGFQPLLLTLPDNKWVKTINWISLRDHRKGETIASLIMPNGPAFTIPSMTQLRPLTPNGLFNISSGPIKVHDYKTIEISNFILKTNGVAVWFMIGTDILPNANGNIVPLFDRKHRTFDCESLRDYNSETVVLRLPGDKDINDVFWLSVFSIPTAVSYSHIYLPYNEMHIPPDLSGLPTPTCSAP